MDVHNVLCLDLGGTGLKGAVIGNGKILKRVVVATDVSNGICGIRNTFFRVLSQIPETEYDGIALSSAGQIDSEARIVRYATELLPGYTGFDLGRFFEEYARKPFVCLNDGQAALRGECYVRGKCNGVVAMLTLGTGVGGGLIDCGGSKVDRTVSLGHLTLEEGGRLCTCGKRGCIEQYASGSALNAALKRYGVVCSKRELWSRYEGGDPIVCRVVGEWLENVRKACDLVYDHYPYRLMILGGGVSDNGKSWFNDLNQSDRYDIELSVLGNDAGVMGAYSFYCENASK